MPAKREPGAEPPRAGACLRANTATRQRRAAACDWRHFTDNHSNATMQTPAPKSAPNRADRSAPRSRASPRARPAARGTHCAVDGERCAGREREHGDDRGRFRNAEAHDRDPHHRAPKHAGECGESELRAIQPPTSIGTARNAAAGGRAGSRVPVGPDLLLQREVVPVEHAKARSARSSQRFRLWSSPRLIAVIRYCGSSAVTCPPRPRAARPGATQTATPRAMTPRSHQLTVFRPRPAWRGMVARRDLSGQPDHS